MRNLRRALPSPNALLTFEAAARLLSFTQAAAELNVTQAAVSRQIASLEARLGRALFTRKHRRLELTRAGSALGQVVSKAFTMMADVTDRLVRDEVRSSLVVGATTAFSHFWLIPRLPEFRRMNPSVTVRIVAQDTRVRLDTHDVDAAFRYGNGHWSDGKLLRLFGDRVGPVAAPSLTGPAGAGAFASEDFGGLPLIEHDYPDSARIGWKDYLDLAGDSRRAIEVSAGYSSYLDVVYAALAGQGVALGWRRMVGTLIQQGSLVPLAPAVEAREGYYLIVEEQPRSPEVLSTFIEWVSARARSEEEGLLSV